MDKVKHGIPPHLQDGIETTMQMHSHSNGKRNQSGEDLSRNGRKMQEKYHTGMKQKALKKISELSVKGGYAIGHGNQGEWYFVCLVRGHAI
jgi:hypothetical protein